MRQVSWVLVGGLFVGLFGIADSAIGLVYDFGTGAGTQHFAYGISIAQPPPPGSNTVPASPFNTTNYSAVATSNDVRYTTGRVDGSGNTLAPATRFVFTISEPRSTVTRLDVLWEGTADEDGFQQVWIWNSVTNSYVQIGTQEDILLPAEGTVLGAITAFASNYVDANNRVTILANHDSDDVTLYTDYVRLTVTGASCSTNAQCDDLVYCNGAESCVGGFCQVGTVVNCNDSSLCTTDSCNEAADQCDNIPINCVDSLFCNGVETCNPVLGCRPGTPINCNDSNACTTDSCNEATDSCNHAAVNCSNGLYCDGVETCDPALGCRPGTAVDCNDGDSCTNDSCNETFDRCDNIQRVPPTAATTPNPTDGKIEVPTSTALGWTGSTSNATCPRVFDVYLDTVNPPVAVAATGLTTPAFTPVSLAAATTFYWNVTTRDCCFQVSGPVWSFTTLGSPVLGANPTSLSFNLSTGQNQQQQVTVTNTGNAPTSWSAIEATAGAGGLGEASAPPAERNAQRALPGINWTAARHPSILLVGFKKDVATNRQVAISQRDAVHAIRKTAKIHSYATIPVDVVQVPAGADLKTLAAQYAAMPEVEFVEPNYIYHANALPNDAAFPSLWGMHNTGQTGGKPDADIDAPEAWDIATGSQTVIVGVIDTGIDYTHPDLAGNMWRNPGEQNGIAGVDDDANGIIDDIYGARWTSGNGLPTNGNPFDDHYHGTHCAGTIGGIGNNGIGVAGVNWNVRMAALKFLSSAGSGFLADAVSAIDYARLKGMNLTSNSWGGGGFSQALKNAIDASGAAGQLFVAAAGNSALNADISPMYPAAYVSPTILSVAATDHNDLLATFSNYGLTSVDLGAPGVNIWSARPGNTYQFLSGTSMATPHAAGVAALVLSQSPLLTPLELKQILMGSTDPIPALSGRCVSGGRLNAFKALQNGDPVPWLSFTPNAGVIWPGQSALLTVTADAAGRSPGSALAGTIRVASGDAASPLQIPITLTVSTCTVDADCIDGLVCNGLETCSAQGSCVAGTAINCNDGVACTTDACTEPAGTCTHVPNNALCDNGLVCDGIETCSVTLGCQTGTPITCNDGVACTSDLCDEDVAGCFFIPDDTLCDNALFCDGFEYCDPALGCQPGFDPCGGLPCDETTDTCGTCATNADCEDFVTCTVDTCDVPTGLCSNLPDDAVCDNGLFCDGAEYCDISFDCQFGGDPCFGLPCNENSNSCGGCLVDADCDDLVGCTLDTCDIASGFCNHTPDDAACGNGLFCDGFETCDALFDCQAAAPVDCDDAVFCTNDFCNEATQSCDHSPDDTACDNGLFCDGTEICDAALDCQLGTPVNCDDGVACTIDACNEATDSCSHTPNNVACDDGLFCNGVESCNTATGCAAGANPCPPGDTCDEGANQCVSPGGSEVWMTFVDAATIPGVGIVQNEDVVAFDLVAGTWTLVFDGSDVGLGALGIDGLAVLPSGDLLISLINNTATVAGLIGGPNGNSVDDSDIIRFTPTSLGSVTAGTFNFYFDGSDVGLTTDAEDIDAIALAPDGRLLISTLNAFGVTGLSGQDEDLLVFNATSLGAVTTGSFAMYFDGSDVGLANAASEDIDAAAITTTGTILLSAEGNFTVPGVTGADEDVFEFTPTTLGGTTVGTYSTRLDLSTLGIDPTEDLSAIEIVE